MGSLIVVEKGADCSEIIDWPLFYMNDFSVLGLRVAKLARALDVLEADGYHVVRQECSAKVDFENTVRFKNIFATLARHGIAHGMSDLADCAYQG
jgi:hypothetical protein